MNIQEHVKAVATQALESGVDEVKAFVIDEAMMGLVKAGLCYANGNQSKASKALGMNRGTLRKYIERYELKMSVEQ